MRTLLLTLIFSFLLSACGTVNYRAEVKETNIHDVYRCINNVTSEVITFPAKSITNALKDNHGQFVGMDVVTTEGVKLTITKELYIQLSCYKQKEDSDDDDEDEDYHYMFAGI